MKLEEKKDFLLVNNTLSSQEANTMLAHLINYKINYHNLDDFSHFVRKDRNIEHSKKRITELQETKNAIKLFIDEAEAHCCKVAIKMTVTLEISK